MKYLVEIAGRVVGVVITGGTVEVGGRVIEARLTGVRGTPVRHLLLGDRSYEVVGTPSDGAGRWRVSLAGHRFDATVTDERAEAVRTILGRGAPRTGGGVIAAPMPGLVVRVAVEPGQHVEPGTGLIVVEAMKMENELRAAAPGTVRRILVAPGAAVEKGQPLVELEPDG